MKIALYIGLFLCAFLIVIGIGLWFTDNDFITKLIMSILAIGAGSALGSMGLELLKDEVE